MASSAHSVWDWLFHTSCLAGAAPTNTRRPFLKVRYLFCSKLVLYNVFHASDNFFMPLEARDVQPRFGLGLGPVWQV